jgi:hypothetical protein
MVSTSVDRTDGVFVQKRLKYLSLDIVLACDEFTELGQSDNFHVQVVIFSEHNAYQYWIGNNFDQLRT